MSAEDDLAAARRAAELAKQDGDKTAANLYTAIGDMIEGKPSKPNED